MVVSHDEIEKILALYPDALFVVSVRDSESFMSSLFQFMRNSTATRIGGDPNTFHGWKETFIERMRRDTLLLIRLSKEVIPEEHQVPVVFRHNTARPNRVIRHIYKSPNLERGEKYQLYLNVLGRKQAALDRGYQYDQGSFASFEQHNAFCSLVSTEVDKVRGLTTSSALETEPTREQV